MISATHIFAVLFSIFFFSPCVCSSGFVHLPDHGPALNLIIVDEGRAVNGTSSEKMDDFAQEGFSAGGICDIINVNTHRLSDAKEFH